MRPIIKPTPKQYLAWETLKAENSCKYPTFGGGAGGGKSWMGCEWLLTNCYFYNGSKWFIGREELSRLKKSTFVTFQKVCRYHKIPREDWKFNGQDNYIEFVNRDTGVFDGGSRIDLLDLAYKPSDPLYERYGSSEYSGGWIEEAGEVKFLAFDVLKSRIGRHLNKEMNIPIKMLITCNPKKNWLYKYVYRPWKDGTLDKDFNFIQSLYNDNPYTAKEYGEQLASIKDKATKQRLMYGNWEYDDDPSTLIDYEAIIDMFTNTVDDSKDKFMTIDIARYGQDKTVFYFWKGWKVYKIKVHMKQGVDITSNLLKEYAREEKIPFSHIIADEDGVGGGVVDTVRGIKGFINNSSQIQTEKQEQREKEYGKAINYQNLKTQCYYLLADKINEHKISVFTDDEIIKEELSEELEYVKTKDMDKDGKLKIISKDEIKEAIGRSPDHSDALMMRMFFELREVVDDNAVKIKQPSWKGFNRK